MVVVNTSPRRLFKERGYMSFGLAIATLQGGDKCFQNHTGSIRVITGKNEGSVFRHSLFDVIPGVRTTLEEPPAGFECFIRPRRYILAYHHRIFDNRAGRIDK